MVVRVKKIMGLFREGYATLSWIGSGSYGSNVLATLDLMLLVMHRNRMDLCTEENFGIHTTSNHNALVLWSVFKWKFYVTWLPHLESASV